MFLQRGSRAVRQQWRSCQRLHRFIEAGPRGAYPSAVVKGFHSTSRMQVVKPVLLADIGEGIVECEIIQWFVEPEARVEEFSPLCEVQSDKASVEITSRFAGVVKKLYYETGEMAKVGKPFVDIDIQGDVKQEDLEALTEPSPESSQGGAEEALNREALSKPAQAPATPPTEAIAQDATKPVDLKPVAKSSGKHASLATPAVRHLCKEHKIEITDVPGTGKDGRVLKEDIFNFIKSRESASSAAEPTGVATGAPIQPTSSGVQVETPLQLTNTQNQMFKTMTRSLSIPHFIYSDELDFTQLVSLRGRLNKRLASSDKDGQISKLSYLPFIIKAVSQALHEYPVLNARVVNGDGSGGGKPSLMLRSQHNIGVAMDTPSGLLVPVIKDVASRSVHSVAAELVRLQQAAVAGKLSVADLSGGTITVSNIGNIGGTYLAPVIVDREVAILGVGRLRAVPAFDENDNVVKKQICNFSWSADHRVIDGATMARAAELVHRFIEEPDIMLLHLK